jgi:hypothetical protein
MMASVMKSTKTIRQHSLFTVVASAVVDLSATGFVVSSESLTFERLSLFSALLASGERARLLDFLRDEAMTFVDRALLIGPGGIFPPLI